MHGLARASAACVVAALLLALPIEATAATRGAGVRLVPSRQLGGFAYPDSVAVDRRTGEVYVAEVDAHRVRELSASGAFVSMFGWDVNATRSARATAAQSEKNVCTAASGDVCQAGVMGTRAGRLDSPESVAVDEETGDVYVLEIEADDFHLDKFTRQGRFVWRVGKGVNESTGANLCTAHELERERERCGAGAPNGVDSVEPGAFKFANQSGDLLAVGGPAHRVYVGDEHRVQVLSPDGHWKGEIPLASLSAQPQSSVVALALAASGELYLVYRAGAVESYLPSERANIVHELDSRGEQVAEYGLAARLPGAVDSIDGLALDDAGDLAAIGVEAGTGASARFGSLLSAATGALLTRFAPPIDNDGIAFGNGDLYVATAVDREVAVYARRDYSMMPSSSWSTVQLPL